MTNIFVLREKIIYFYRRHAGLLRRLFQMLVAFMLLMLMRGYIGYNETFTSVPVILVITLCCAVLPWGFITGIMALIMLAHLYSLSVEALAAGVLLLLVLLLLYFAFSPRNILLFLLTPILYACHLHYVLPVAAGLLFAPGSCAAVVFGVILSHFIEYIHTNETVLIQSWRGSDVMENFRRIVDGAFTAPELWILVVSVIVSTMIVYYVRRTSFNRSWIAAIVTGSVCQLLIILIGDMFYDSDMELVPIFLGMAGSIVIEFIIRLFAFNVDYSHVETVQFEDDDYYYYVKAVPKVQVSLPSRKVKTISNAADPADGEEDHPDAETHGEI